MKFCCNPEDNYFLYTFINSAGHLISPMRRCHPSTKRPFKAHHYAKKPPGYPCKSDAGILLLCVTAVRKGAWPREGKQLPKCGNTLPLPYWADPPFQRAIKDKKVLLLTAGQRLQQRSGSSTEGHKEGKWGPGTAWESRLRVGPSQAQATLSTNQPDVRSRLKREERTWEV